MAQSCIANLNKKISVLKEERTTLDAQLNKLQADKLDESESKNLKEVGFYSATSSL